MTQIHPPTEEGKPTSMTIWGIGPRLILLAAAYAIPIVILQWIVYPRLLIQGVPYAVFAVLGSALIAGLAGERAGRGYPRRKE